MNENEEKKDDGEKSVDDVMQALRDEYEAKLAEKDAQLERERVEHAQKVRDMLMGRDKAANERKTLETIAEEVAAVVNKKFRTMGV